MAASGNDILLVHCVRHGESEANAGAATSDPASIPLTETGRQQAQLVASRINQMPDHLVCSPFLRARQTAAPAQDRFSLPVASWPIHEFTYLSPSRCAGTSAAERRTWVQAYWDTADPHLVDGHGAESFNAFIQRVRHALADFEQLRETGLRTVFAFGHGQFFQALRWQIESGVGAVDAEAMRAFRMIDLANPIRNATGFSAAFDGRRWSIVDRNW